MVATPSSATMGPLAIFRPPFCGGAAETDGTVHRSLSCTSDIKGSPLARKRVAGRHSAFHGFSLPRYHIYQLDSALIDGVVVVVSEKSS